MKRSLQAQPLPLMPFTRTPPVRVSHLAAVLVMTSLLAACSTTPSGPGMPVLEEQANYAAHARSYYAAPGPRNDPWGPYINEASARFDVPELWIRTVMERESGGKLYDSSGHFITSMPGAMGLMQIMPPAYDDLRAQYNLGPDPYSPHDNIIAGTAYIRQMYDIYGSPGFLAAYNDGPGNVDRYLRQNRPLPRETRNYVRAIGRQIAGIWPEHRSQADLMVARHDPTQQNSLPQNIAINTTEPAYSNERQSVSNAWAARGFASTPQVPSLSQPRRITPQPIPQHNTTVRIRSIPLAYSHTTRHHATDMARISSQDWSIQIGSFRSRVQAQNVAARLRHVGGNALRRASTNITPLHTKGRLLYRTRLTNLSEKQARMACNRLQQISACMVLSPRSRF